MRLKPAWVSCNCIRGAGLLTGWAATSTVRDTETLEGKAFHPLCTPWCIPSLSGDNIHLSQAVVRSLRVRKSVQELRASETSSGQWSLNGLPWDKRLYPVTTIHMYILTAKQLPTLPGDALHMQSLFTPQQPLCFGHLPLIQSEDKHPSHLPPTAWIEIFKETPWKLGTQLSQAFNGS